ncbi:MAG: tetratricopeptide repeat protein [bacterium]
MRPKVGVVQFAAVSLEGDEHALACGVTYEVARRLTSLGGLEANAILLGPADREEGALGGASDAPSLENTTGLSVPGMGARYESDYLLLGQVRVTDGLLFDFRVFDGESGRLLRQGCVSGLRTSVCRLLDDVAEEVRRTIGLSEDETERDFDPVVEHLDFHAFVEYCLAREAESPEEAQRHLERALTIAPSFRVALVEYLSFTYQADALGRSLALLDAYLNRHPDDQEILIAAGNLCLAFHRVDEGIRFAGRAIGNRPDDVEPNVIMARFLFAKEMPLEARAHLDCALESQDASSDALYSLGRYFLDLGEFYRARDYFERCLDIEPGYYVALRDLQCCYYELGDFAKGIEICETLLETDPTDAGSHYNLGLIYQRLGRTRLAAKFFEEAVRQDPSFYKAHYMLGEHCVAEGRAEEALRHFQEAHAASPHSAEALGRMGDCHALLGSFREAHRHYVRARREDPFYENARFHVLEGKAFAEEGNLVAARRELTRATELDADLAEAWNELAWVLLVAGLPQDALDAVRRAAELEPEHAGLLANVLACARALPLSLRFAGETRRVMRDARTRLARLTARGIVPNGDARRTLRRRLSSLTWYALRG